MRTLKMIVLWSLLVPPYYIAAQNQEILVPEYNYTSGFEKSLFEVYQKDSVNFDFIKTLFAIDSSYTLEKATQKKQQIDDFIKRMEKKVRSHNPKKALKTIFKNTHDRFFKKYELDANFSDIFRSGTYNCVTGTALYSYVFDYFNIPYEIKEVPTHVFIVAYPKKYNIYVETTVPGKSGSYIPSEKAIQKAVEELVRMKLITQDHVNKVGPVKAYNEYFYGNENINKSDLVGIQYFNDAILKLNNEEYTKAAKSINKAKAFYKNHKVDFLREGILAVLVDESDFKEINNFKWYMKYVDISKDNDFLKYKLYKILSEDTRTEKEFDFIETAITNYKDETKKNTLLEIYYLFQAERLSKLQKDKLALEFAEKVYTLNPNNLDAKDYISRGIIRKLYFKGLNKDTLGELNAITEQYPFIKDFGSYNTFKILLYSYLVAENYSNNNHGKGSEYIDELEALLNQYKDEVDYSQELVGKAYGQAGAYYYRRRNKANALEILNKGLKYAPNSDAILKKIKIVKNAM